METKVNDGGDPSPRDGPQRCEETPQPRLAASSEEASRTALETGFGREEVATERPMGTEKELVTIGRERVRETTLPRDRAKCANEDARCSESDLIAAPRGGSVAASDARGGEASSFAPSSSSFSSTTELRSVLEYEFNRRGVATTWLPDMTDHLWDYNAWLEDVHGSRKGVDHRRVLSVVDEAMRCMALPKNPGCSTNGCPDSLTLMIHELAFLRSGRNKMLYYNPECSQHGLTRSDAFARTTVLS